MELRIMNRNRIFLAIAAAFSLASCVTSPDVPSSAQGRAIHFSELDKNKDGVLTPDELPERLELTLDFPRYDLNGDGVVNMHEFNEYLAANDSD
jgi:hypothetical protein